MAKMYLRGVDVETDPARRKARLLGIANETHVYYCNQLGNEYYPNCETKYCFSLKEKMKSVLDENGDPVLDERGQPTYIGIGEDCLEIDTEQAEYSSLHPIHVNRLKTREEMLTDGWFINE